MSEYWPLLAVLLYGLAIGAIGLLFAFVEKKRHGRRPRESRDPSDPTHHPAS